VTLSFLFNTTLFVSISPHLDLDCDFFSSHVTTLPLSLENKHIYVFVIFRRYKYEYTGTLLNAGTSAVAVIHHKFIFSSIDVAEEEVASSSSSNTGVNAFESDVILSSRNKKSFGSVFEVVEEGAGVGGGHKHAPSGLVRRSMR
jgi:hypothetical protein